jgi:hypothetical protein
MRRGEIRLAKENSSAPKGYSDVRVYNRSYSTSKGNAKRLCSSALRSQSVLHKSLSTRAMPLLTTLKIGIILTLLNMDGVSPDRGLAILEHDVIPRRGLRIKNHCAAQFCEEIVGELPSFRVFSKTRRNHQPPSRPKCTPSLLFSSHSSHHPCIAYGNIITLRSR